MTYPPSSSGYPPSQQPTTQFSAPTQQFGKVEQQQHQQGSVQTPAAITPSGPSRLPFILLTAVAVLGLLVYLFSFGEVFTIESSDFPQMGSASGTSQGVVMAVVAALVSGLIAGASLLPRQKAPIGVIAAVALLAFLLVLAEVIQKPEGVSIGWALYVLILLTFLQSAVAIGALLFDSGIIKAPVSKPKYDKQQQQNYGALRPAEPVLRPAGPASGTAAASAVPGSGPVRRRLLGRRPLDRRLRPDRPAGRSADPSDRLPDLQPAAVVAVRPGPVRAGHAAAVVVLVEPVRQLDVVISRLARVNTARVRRELLYR